MRVINDFLSGVDNDAQRAELARIRLLIKQIVPDAEEVISYGMPGFKVDGKYLIGFCTFKKHMSLFPTSGPIVELKEKLVNYKTSKGAIQFTLENRLSDELIREIVMSRLESLRGAAVESRL